MGFDVHENISWVFADLKKADLKRVEPEKFLAEVDHDFPSHLLMAFFELYKNQFDRRHIETLRNIQTNLPKLSNSNAALTSTIQKIDSLINTILDKHPIPLNVQDLIIEYDPRSGSQLATPMAMTEKRVARMTISQADDFGKELCEPQELAVDRKRVQSFLQYASIEQRHAFFHGFLQELQEKCTVRTEIENLNYLVNKLFLIVSLLPNNLDTFDLSGLHFQYIESFLSQVAQQCPDLRFLNLNLCELNDRIVKEICFFEKLEKLEMRGARKGQFDEVSVYQRLAEEMRTLKELDIRDSTVTTPENVAAIRQHITRTREIFALDKLEILIVPEDISSFQQVPERAD